MDKGFFKLESGVKLLEPIGFSHFWRQTFKVHAHPFEKHSQDLWGVGQQAAPWIRVGCWVVAGIKDTTSDAIVQHKLRLPKDPENRLWDAYD